ncbi:MATE family efflux transporter [Plasticicumulans sp.]|uniref:MATE family efflux transporter n=1 Tax=Plasticicumulans sp. TaxID=2307179 RepID=UPI002BC544DB|nr:MATE family efflux transporter [Plasticicumulans sp.]MBS0601164.1 MATE family efflux transporter [Pseudomonadota bacterium]HNF65346.1 MATE family efflux transporter [Plasticicumulans sp.]HNG49660.1 MATE family efflux transporter [Plasticicumulans sp.]HNJ07577.1 MATE family efflux transporter [Plasticicumulans sp.]HNM43034.1 MATE family efflux transporter [Plasticicumulans sp.]
MTDAATAVPSRAAILRFAAPVMLANLTTPLLGIVDTAIMGRSPDPALIAAVAVGSTVLTVLFWAFSFLRQSTVGLTAQALGAGDATELAAALLRPLALAALIGTVLILLQAPIAALAFGLMTSAPEVETAARAYYGWRIAAAPFALANYALAAWLIGQRRARLVLGLQLAMNGGNAALTALFVLGFGLGPAGAGLGTALAEMLTCLATLGLPAVRAQFAPAVLRAVCSGGRAQFARLMRANRDILLRTLVLTLTLASFTRFGGTLSTATLAANQVLMQWLVAGAYFLDGFANAAEVWGGAAVGAGDRAALAAVARRTGELAFACALLLAGLFWLAGDALIALITVSAEVRALADACLPWLVLSPIAGVAAFQFDGLFFGATRTAPLRDMMVLAAGGYALALWWWLPRWGNHGLWAALMLFFVLRSVLLAACWPALKRSVGPA